MDLSVHKLFVKSKNMQQNKNLELLVKRVSLQNFICSLGMFMAKSKKLPASVHECVHIGACGRSEQFFTA
jgi:hypothetical protein